MDSKKRHELETNDLREFLDNFKDFWDKNGNGILIALIVVVGGYTAWNLYKGNKAEKINDAQAALSEATGGAYLLSIAQEHPRAKNRALLWAGDAFLEDARAAAAAGEDDEATKHLDSAEGAYQQLIDGCDIDLFKINAYLGLATAAEMRADWDKADGYYKDANALAAETYGRLATLAQLGRDGLDDLKTPVPFGTDIPEPDPLPDTPFDPNDLDGDGTPDILQRPEDAPTPGTLPGTLPGNTPDDTLFPEDGAGLPGLGGDGDGDGGTEDLPIDPLLDPGGE